MMYVLTGILLMVFVVCLLQRTALSLGTHCTTIHSKYNTYRPDRVLEVDGHDAAVQVLVEGGVARAGGALLLAGVRHRLRYAAQLIPDLSHRCALVIDHYREPIVAAGVEWDGCGERQYWQKLAPAAVPFARRLLVHVPRSSTYSNIDQLPITNCSKSDGDTRTVVECFVVLARDENVYDSKFLTNLTRGFQYKNKSVTVKRYKNDLLFRRKLYELRRRNKTFLFIDEDIWIDEPNVFNIPWNISNNSNTFYNSEKTVRLGYGYFMSWKAPPIANLVNRFSPKPEHLRYILDNEASNITDGIEEAACQWALQNEQHFEGWFRDNAAQYVPSYTLCIFICDDESYNEYLTTLRVIKKFLPIDINFTMKTTAFDCSSAKSIEKVVFSNTYYESVAGAVTWARAEGASEVQSNVPVLLAGPTPPAIQLPAARVATGTLTQLAVAFQQFFYINSWSRVAIISDSTAYAKNLTKAITNNKKILYREDVLFDGSSKRVLENFKKLDARLFFVNTDWMQASKVLCEASQLGLTFNGKHVWIVRDWKHTTCDGSIKIDIKIYTLGMSWRGGQAYGGSVSIQQHLLSAWNINEPSNSHMSRQSRLPSALQYSELGGPPDAAMLCDAVLQLANSLVAFYHYCPTCFSKHRCPGNIKLFSEFLDETYVTGIAQNYAPGEYNSSTGPYIYVSKWTHSGGHLLAVWRTVNDSIKNIWPDSDGRISEKVSDGSSCLTFTTGDDFNPRCHTLVLCVAITVLFVAFPALIVVRYIRLRGQTRRENALKTDLLKYRRRATSNLFSYLVERNSITLLHEIGSGYFGRVYCSELKCPNGDKLTVAVKRPRESLDQAAECEFLREATVLAPLCHENVIRLVGVCLADGPPLVLMEYAHHTDLQRFLARKRMRASTLTRLAREASGAVAYLAAARLVHRDVRAANCLVDEHRSLKLADFGMARRLGDGEPEYAATRRGLFPILWMAPESLERGVFSTATDVWALGVLLLEVVTLGARPFGSWPLTRVLSYVLGGAHAPLPPDVSNHTRAVVTACWRRAPEQRPSAEAVRAFLQTHTLALSPTRPHPAILTDAHCGLTLGAGF